MPNPVTVDWKEASQGREFRSALEASSALIDLGQFATAPPSQALSERAVKVGDAPRLFYLPALEDSLESSLFTNRATLKIITSQVAMHLTEEERKSLFFAIDRLLDRFLPFLR